MFLKVYRIDNEVLVAVCDEGCLGKEYAEGDLSLKVTKAFYGDDPADRDEVVSALCEATIANIVGEQSVAVAVENGLVDVKSIIYIAGVPHVQIVCM